MSKKSLKPTSAAEWRKPREEGEIVPLPSGLVAKLRPADLLKMIRAGSIPDILSDVAAKSMWGTQEPDEIGNDFEMAKKYDQLMGVVLPAIFVEPKVAMIDEEPADDEISIDDIELADRTFAFNMAIMGASSMRKFRREQEERLASLSDGNENSDKAE